ncbi:hypothetical protein BZG36_02221 [Bifiguratus adelaidae]|uniref:Cytochrome P450 n=1 Tax=Bifiguratus adelaidae TaxID=1938954 RepID=A0A261Y3H8_9FUNG|nr:hypothetical protein BZG36_02221 [Bifiguratus adelaidae]
MSLKANLTHTPYLGYIGAGSALVFGTLLAMYPDRAVFAESRPDLTGGREWPLVGNLPMLIQMRDKAHDVAYEAFKELGSTVSFTAFMFPRQIMLSDPRCVEHVLKGNFENYVKGPTFHAAMDDLFGHGIFNADGKEWKWQRKTASQIFNVKNFRDLFTEIFVDEIAYMKQNIFDVAADRQEAIDFHSIMFKFTLDSFVRIGFGVDLECVKKPGKIPFAEAFDAAQTMTARRMLSPFWKAEEAVAGFFGKGMKDYVKVVDKFANDVIAQRRAHPNKAEFTDLLSRFMQASDENGVPLNDRQLRDAILNMIIAGRDTTAQALSWSFYVLSNHPKVEAKLLEEIEQYVREDMQADDLYTAIKDMKYAHAFFYEVLRFYPSVPTNQKYALGDDILPDGTHIKKGDYVAWSPYAQGRLERVWGPDAAEFKPDRWLVDGDLKKMSQGQWPSFHAGPRVCLGQNLATLEALVAICLLLKRYHLSLVPGQDITYALSLTLPMKNGMKVMVERRQ